MTYVVPAQPILPAAVQTATAFQQQSNPEGLGLLLLILTIVICLIGTMVTLNALLPGVASRSKAALQGSPWRAFFVGLANYIFLIGIALIIFAPQIDFLNLIGVVILGFLAGVTILGLGGLTQLTGERMAEMRTSEMSPLKQIIWGTIVIELTGLLPFIGWFLLAPVMLMAAFGAAVLGWRSRKQPEKEVQL